MYPNVKVFRKVKEAREPQPYPALTPETIVLPAMKPVDVRIPFVEIKDRKNNKLITAIEILSPVNKRKPGLEAYREKRLRLHHAGVHLIEIDLLRRGERPLKHPYLPKSHYLVSLVRAGSRRAQLWAVHVKEPLPIIPVPLKEPDEDTFLDLNIAFKHLYHQCALERSIDYSESPPPPAFTEEEANWIRSLGCMAG